MTALDRDEPAQRWAFAETEDPAANVDWEVSPDDRVGPPLRRRRGKLAFRGLLVVLVAAGGGWAYVDAPSMWSAGSRLTTAVADAGASLLSTRQQKTSAPPSPESARPADPTSVAAPSAPSPAPDPAAAAAAAPATPAVEAPLATLPAGEKKPAAEPAAPVIATAPDDPSAAYAPPPPQALTPWQKRASAVGLHPELSRALLEKLSAADYRNAGRAIETALATKADDSVVAWPREAAPGVARFEVHFVAGASSGCRRYVVTIAKEGWLTTAPPVEKCGTRRGTAPG